VLLLLLLLLLLLPPAVCEYVWRQQQESYADGPCASACSRM
jgi:hypothetical protein